MIETARKPKPYAIEYATVFERSGSSTAGQEPLEKTAHSFKRIKRESMQDKATEDRQGTDEWAADIQKVALERDRAAFNRLFQHFGPKLKSYILMLKSSHTSPEMAEELVQEVMLKIWLKAHWFNPEKASASTWIFTVARNCRIDFIRKANRTNTPLNTEDLWPLGEDDNEPYTSLQQRRIEKTIHGALKELPDEQAQILKHVYLEGQSHSEVSANTGLPLGTVKSRVRLAMKKLKVLVD